MTFALLPPIWVYVSASSEPYPALRPKSVIRPGMLSPNCLTQPCLVLVIE